MLPPVRMREVFLCTKEGVILERGNIFAEVRPSAEEYTEVLKADSNTRIERIVSHGQVSPPGFWYDQNEWEFVVVLHGNAELETESERIAMKPGDWVIIPAHERHRVTYTSSTPPCVWLAVFGGMTE